VDVTEVHPIPVTHECGHVPEHTEICPAIESASAVAMACPGKQNGQNRATEEDIRIRICRREAHGMTENKMVQPDTEEHQEGRKELARNRRGLIVGGRRGLETCRPSTHIKWKRYFRTTKKKKCKVYPVSTNHAMLCLEGVEVHFRIL
jgi:hypothetical protein